MTAPVRIALAASLCGLCSSTARSQSTAVPPAAPIPSTAAVPDVQYDTYFEPFDDNPIGRLQFVTPFPPPTRLFPDFDPLDGLDQHVKTSRVALTHRAVFAFPVKTVHVGDKFTMPFLQLSGPGVSSCVVKVSFDPNVVKAVRADKAEFQALEVAFNDAPEHKTPESRFIALGVAGNAWDKRGALMQIEFTAVAPGDSDIDVYDFDCSDNDAQLIPSLVRRGLVRVTP